MKPTIQSVHFDADKKLIQFVEDKIAKLTQFYEGIIGVGVILKLDKSSDNANKIAEIKVKISGKELFSERQCSSFEEAVDLSADAIRTQLLKEKEKRQ
jgi:putative sigma-54 modulation protein